MKYLRNIDFEEVSLVDSPANRKKRFMVIKQYEETLQDQLAEIFDEDSEEDISRFILAKADQLSEEEMEQFREAVRLASDYAGDMPDDMLESIRAMLIHFKTEEKEPEKKPEEEEKIAETDEERDERLAKKKEPEILYPSLPIPFIKKQETPDPTLEQIIEKATEGENLYPSLPTMVKVKNGVVMVTRGDEYPEDEEDEGLLAKLEREQKKQKDLDEE